MSASTRLTPEQRVLRARVAAYARWSREDGRAQAQRAQAGLREKFVRQVREQHPDLAETEIQRRGECAYREHMSRLALASSKARTGRNRARRGGGRDG